MSSQSPQSLGYAGPQMTDDGPVIQVRADGVVLRLERPSLSSEVTEALAVTFLALVFGVAAVGAGVDLLPGKAASLLDAARCAGFGVVCVVCTISAVGLWSRVGRVRRNDPSVSMLFLASAAIPASAKHDPVRSVEARLDQRETNFRRRPLLFITTARGQHHELFRGRPMEELEPLARELRMLLCLDAAPTNGFPVVLRSEGSRE